MKYNDNWYVNAAMPIVPLEYSSTHWKTSLGCLEQKGVQRGGAGVREGGKWLAIEIQTPELCIIMPVGVLR